MAENDMAELGPASGSNLWPDPALMHQYVDAWAKRIISIEDQFSQEMREHATLVAEYVNTIQTLQDELETVKGPLQRRIAELQAQRSNLEFQLKRYQEAEKVTLERLAVLLEVTPVKGDSIDKMLISLSVLVDESKKQFRNSL